MTFEQPLLLLTLLAAAGATGLLLLVLRRRARYTVRFTNLEVLARVAQNRSWRRFVAPALFLLALSLLAVALARPHVNRLVPTERATVILVIDTSRSMQSQDVRPSRLAAAQAAARTFLDRVPKRLRVGLVLFSGEAEVAARPTTDRELVRESIDLIGPYSAGGGTAIGDAIARAVELGREAVGGPELASVQAASPQAGPVSILFLSDGRQNRGILPPLQGAALAKAAGIPVYTVALGRPGFSAPGPFGFRRNRAPDPATLRAIARATGGEFFAARSAKALQSAYEQLGSRLGRAPRRSEVTHLFLGAAAAVLLGSLLLSTRWSSRLP